MPLNYKMGTWAVRNCLCGEEARNGPAAAISRSEPLLLQYTATMDARERTAIVSHSVIRTFAVISLMVILRSMYD